MSCYCVNSFDFAHSILFHLQIDDGRAKTSFAVHVNHPLKSRKHQSSTEYIFLQWSESLDVANEMKISFFVGIFLIHANSTNGAYPLEHTIAMMTNTTPPKTWFVFMERRCFLCLDGSPISNINNMLSFLRCLTFKYDTKWTCILKIEEICYVMKRNPNVLTYIYGNDWEPTEITLSVHEHFYMNITITHFQLHADSETFQGIEITTGNTSKKYSGRRLSWSVLQMTNSIVIKSFRHCSRCITMQYDITTLDTSAENGINSAPNFMYFGWGYSYIYCLQIRVEMISRITVSLVPSVHSKITVYDGPSALLPIITETSGILRNSYEITSSTFQVFVIVIFDKSIDAHGKIVRYKPKTVTESICLDRHQDTLIRFNNDTNCHSLTPSARLCVFKIRNSNLKNLKLTLIKLKFNGVYLGSTYTAGAAIFDIIHGRNYLIYDLYDDNWVTENGPMNFFSSENGMYFIIYSYAVYVSIESEAIVSQSECISLYFDKSSGLHSQYLSYIGGRYVHWYATNISLTTQVAKCIRLQPLENYRFKFETYRMGLKFQINLIAKYFFRTYCVNLVKYSPYFCPPLQRVLSSAALQRRHRGTSCRDEYGIATFESLIVNFCRPLACFDIEFRFIGCKIPCMELGIDVYDAPRSCDICRMYYTQHSHGNIQMPMHSTFDIHIISRQCTSMMLMFCRFMRIGGAMCFGIGIQNDMTIRIPKFKAIAEVSLGGKQFRCSAEIPLDTITGVPVYQNFIFEIARPKISRYRGRYLYTLMTSNRPVSWNNAASICKSVHGFLLTVYSQNEYDFLEKTFLSFYDISILYIGFQLKVIYSWLIGGNSLLSNNKCVTIFFKSKPIIPFIM